MKLSKKLLMKVFDFPTKSINKIVEFFDQYNMSKDILQDKDYETQPN